MNWVAFDRFAYRGIDPFALPHSADHYLNPIVAGFYPDPSVCRVGEDYYLVNSSFTYFPGVPIFHSRDLVHWRQLGHVLDRPTQLRIGPSLHTSAGIYAPTISHHGGIFRVVTTLVDGGGNFYVESDRPDGPWSDPIWLRDVDGIDPSFFFDDDGKTYVLNNGGPPDDRPRYDGHRAIWMQEMDFAARRSIGPRKIVINGGVDLAKNPIWIEGPHLLKRDGWYILHAAEGGPGLGHSQVVFRSRSVWGPYEPWSQNPILTQRALPADRDAPITCTGHADLIETADGNWWAVFLGCRPDAQGHELTGRETFLLPVTWIDGWPRILEPGRTVPRSVAKARLASARGAHPTTGNIEFADDFATTELRADWVMLRTPDERWFDLANAHLRLWPRRPVWERGSPAYLGRRLQHSSFSAELVVRADSIGRGAQAGVLLFQNDTHHLFFYLARDADG